MQPKTYLPKRLTYLLSLLGILTFPVLSFSHNINAEPSSENAWMVDAGPDQNICIGETAQLMVSGATSYEWTPANSLSCTSCPDPVASPTTTTDYIVMGDDGTIDTVRVAVFSPPTIVSVNATDPTDCNLPNGTIVIDATASGPLEYSIDGGNIWSAVNFFTALPSGTYTPTVRHVGGACVTSANSLSIQAPTAPEILNVSGSNPTLCDTPNGAIIVSATGGIPPLEYSINGGMTWQASNTFQLLTSGNYGVLARNADGSCETVGGVVSLTGSPDEADITDVLLFGPSSCVAADGLVTVIVSNDTGNFEYSIDGGTSFQSANNFTNLIEGTYEIVVRRDDGSCSVSGGFFELTSSLHPELFGASVIQPTNCGTNDGNITILAFGPSPLEYSIDGGNTWLGTNIFAGLNGGAYPIAIRNIDGSCPTFGEVIVLDEPAAPTINNVAATNPSACVAADGSIVIDANGSTALEFSINNGIDWFSNGTFSNLSAGQYNVQVRLAGTVCITSYVGNPVVLSTTGNVPTINNVTVVQPGVCGAFDGSITIDASGVGILEYSIDNGASWQPNGNYNGLGNGSYTIIVREQGSNCEIAYQNNPVELISIGNIPIINAVFEQQPGNCGVSNGTISINASGANVLEYSIDNGVNWNNNNVFNGLGAGSYNVVVREIGTTCQTSFQDNPIQFVSNGTIPTIVDVSVAQPSDCGVLDGSLTINASGSSALEYSIDNGVSWDTNNAFIGLGPGFYNVRVREIATGCEAIYTSNPVELQSTGAAPTILNVNDSQPTTCGATDGTIFINVAGTSVEYSIDGGINYSLSPSFFALGAGSYNIRVREIGTGCETVYVNNPVELTTPGDLPIVSDIQVVQPTICGAGDGSITIIATGSGPLEYSIDNGNNFQSTNAFTGLNAGTYEVVVALMGNVCPVSETIALADIQTCLDTVQVTIPANAINTICLDAAVFDFPGLFTSVGFCGQGTAQTVLATSIAGECVTVSPAMGFTGLSPDLICTVHCFNNNPAQCDTTYIQINVDGSVLCDPIFPIDTVEVPFLGDPTGYCVPIPFASIPNYTLSFQGVPLTNPFICDLDQTVAYSYGFLPGGGLEGPYELNIWTVDGTPFSGIFNDPGELNDLMNSFDPAGFWQINSMGSIIFGGNPSSQYGNMEITQVSSGIPTVLMTNFTFQPQGFTVVMSNPGEHVLIATDTITGCMDTLVINAAFDLPDPEVVTLTTTVNTPTSEYCLDGMDLPGGLIETIGFCANPLNGGAPIVSDSCVFYVPNANFAGVDEFCMIVCETGFPQICDTTFFIVNVLPETDTVYLNIPTGENSLDTCLSNLIIELPAAVETTNICGINSSELSAVATGNCVNFNVLNNFFGTSEVCVEFCSNGICDQTIFIIEVSPPVTCEDIFTEDQVTILSVVDQGFYCVPVSPGNIVNYQATVDGNPFIAFTPCNFGDVLFYNYSTMATGPFFLDSWVVNGVTYMQSFNSIDALIDSMNIWDPVGNWENNIFGLTINGGSPSNIYGNIIITDSQGTTITIEPDVVVLPLGANLTVNGFGTHEVILTELNGCSDTLTIVLQQHFVNTDTLYYETGLNTSVVPICATTDELLGSLQNFNLCGLPSDGSIAIIGDTCVSYTPNLNFLGTDEFCLVVCDDYQPTVCDTFFVIINTQLPVDTVFVDADNVTPFDECLDGTVLQLPGSIDTAFICGSDPSIVALDFLGNCVSIDLADSFVGTTEACVVHCTDGPPTICDTTYLVITFDGVFPCDDLFNPDQTNVVLENDTGEICLPVSILDINDYSVFLDGAAYAGNLTGCDIDSVYTYFYSQVFGQGNAGPYDITWDLNGTIQSGTVVDMVALVNLMNGLDPLGNWQLDQTLLTISSSNDNGTYGVLEIVHSSGSVAGLTPNFNGFPNGTLITFSGSGQHELVLVNNFTACDDTLFINAVNMLDTLQLMTIEDIPTLEECIDTSGLTGIFDEMSLCENPVNGTVSITGNCFIYTPDPGFTGSDEFCLQICDEQGNCEATVVFVTVDPLCAQYDFFPSGVIDISAPDCADQAIYCLPIELDSLVNFGILDNGVPVSNFSACNGNFSAIALDTGFHEIIVVHLMTQCSDTLLLSVNCTPDDGCGSSAINGLNLFADDCDAEAEFCVDIAVADLGNFEVTQNGSVPGQIGPCSSNPQFVGIALDTGFYELIFADTVKGCVDTFLVNVNCLEVEDTTINIEIIEGDSTEVCLSDFDFPVATIDSLVNICDDQSDGNANFVIDTTNWCITIFGEVIGMDTFCMKAYFGDTCAVLTVNVDVISSCPDYFPDDQLLITSSCVSDSVLACLPMEIEAYDDLEIIVNGMVYDEPLTPCSFDTMVIFPYFELPSAGLIGPYDITEWVINGDTVTGTFNSANEMADLMSNLDPTATWTTDIDDNGNVIISGGSTTSIYGALTAEQTLFANVVVLDIQVITNVVQYGIILPAATSSLSFRDTLTNCTEDVIADVFCVDTDTIVTDIELGQTDTLCLDLSELTGSVVSVTNECPQLGGTNVSYEIIGECVVVFGLSPGIDTACIVVCDDQNICDTTIFLTTAIFENTDTLINAVDDQITAGEGQVILINVLQNDEFTTLSSFSIIDMPLNGQAAFLPNGEINYVPDNGYCDDEMPDTFTYEICSGDLCDTATVSVLVLCDDLEIFTGFSPNEDGRNDSFRIKGLQNWPDHHLYIYNRWGNLVYEAVDYQSDWIGTWKEKEVPDGTYFYVLDLGNGEEPLNGYVQIRR